jgi:chromosome segregation ATPase
LRFYIDERVQRLYERIMSETSKRFEENESKVNRCLNAFTSYSGDARKMKEMVDDIK